MEWNGIPIDLRLFRNLREHWVEFRTELVAQVEAEHRFDVYVPAKSSYSFNYNAFLVKEGLDDIWKRTSCGRACLKDDYVKEMALMFPRLGPLRALRKTLSGLNTLDPPVGSDGRNRSSIRPFAAKTSRNQPRTCDMIKCFPAWARSLMRAETPFGIRDSTVFSTTGPGGMWDEGTHGSKLVENIIQSIAWDVLCDGLLAAATAGFNLIGHVHDEIITEERDGSVNDAGKLEKLMSTAPGWARSLKLGAEAAKLNFYSK
jgi:hypothetical protein